MEHPKDVIMPRKEGHKRLLQKISHVISYISLTTAVICAGYLLMINGEEDKVLKASIGAIAFFCFTVGMVLKAIGEANLPDLSVKPEDKPEH